MFQPASDVNNGLGKPSLVRVKTAIRSLEDADIFVNSRIRSDGTFNCYLGEEILINDGKYNDIWQVVGVNTELGKGDTPLTKPHISLVPKTILTLGKMHSGKCDGYANTDMHNTILPNIVSSLETVLGEHLLERRVKLSNATSSDTYMASANGYYSAKANLLCRQQVFGTVKNSNCGNLYDIGYDTDQLPGFAAGKVNVRTNSWYWLRDICGYYSGYYFFGVVGPDEHLNASAVNSSNGVRPLITIG